MGQILLWLQERIDEFRESNAQLVTRREYVAMIALVVFIGVVALFK